MNSNQQNKMPALQEEEVRVNSQAVPVDVPEATDEELSHFPPSLESLQKELIEVKRVMNVFGNYLKKVEHVLGFHNEHLKRVVMKDAEETAKQIGAELNPKTPDIPTVTDAAKVIRDFSHPVKELTEENMIPSQTTILMLYTHTCPHCVTLKPIYEQIAPTLVDMGINVAAINVARQRKAAIEYQVKGVPSIRLVHNGTKHEYKGQRTNSEIISWVKSIL